MSKYLSVPVIASVLLLCSFTVVEKWADFTSATGHYSISFPGKVEESEDENKTQDGGTFKMHMAMCSPSDDALYMVGWVNMVGFYPEGKTIKQLLEDSRDGAVAQLKGTDVVTTTTNTSGEPYIEFTFSTAEFVGKDRIYVINKCQYSIITLFSPKIGMQQTSADKFIGSFKYIK